MESTLTPYALRFWKEDIDKIDETAPTDWNYSFKTFINTNIDSNYVDGSRVLIVNVNEQNRPSMFGLISLETFNQNFEWRDRDDTIGLFTKAHKK